MSIEDPQESLFIQQNLQLLHDEAKSFWIGLYKTDEGELVVQLFFRVKKLSTVPIPSIGIGFLKTTSYTRGWSLVKPNSE